MIVWATLATANYLPIARPYLASVARHGAGIDALWLGCVGCAPPSDLPAPWGGFAVPAHWLDTRLGNPGNGCIQHGSFLPYLPAGRDDVIVLTDGDIVMQRALTAAERGMLLDWPAHAIGIGPNAGPDDTLLDEARRIRGRVDDLPTRCWPGRAAPRCGNAGVLVARRSTWLELWAADLALLEAIGPLFHHRAMQQWLLNLAIESLGRIVLPTSFHAHQHYGVPPGCEDRDGVAYADGRPTLLAHHWWA